MELLKIDSIFQVSYWIIELLNGIQYIENIEPVFNILESLNSIFQYVQNIEPGFNNSTIQYIQIQ